MDQTKIVMMQSVELNNGPVGNFLIELKSSRDQVAAQPPEGFLYSRGGFVVGSNPLTFEVLTGWECEKYELAFRQTPFYASTIELFQKHSNKPISTKIIKVREVLTKPEAGKYLEVFAATLVSPQQNPLIALLQTQQPVLSSVQGYHNSFVGVTDEEVFQFISWESLQDCDDFRDSEDGQTFTNLCNSTAAVNRRYRIKL